MSKRWNLLLPLVVLCIVGVVVFIKHDELGEFADTVRNVQMLPFSIAVCCLFGRYLMHAFAYKGMFQCVGEEVSYFKIVPLVFSVTFANDCAPTAGTAGSVLVGAWAHKQGMPGGKAVSVVFLEKVGYFGGFSVVMMLGFIILLITGQMQSYLLLGCLAMLFMIGSVGIILVLGYHRQSALERFLGWIERRLAGIMGFFRHGPILIHPKETAESFHGAAVLAANNPRIALKTFLRFVLAHAFDCACFISTGFAFGFTTVPFLIAGYVAGFIIATFIIQTVGAVEILIAMILGSYGAAGAVAAAVALCYRGLIFWVPFAIGAVCINFTGKAQGAAQGTVTQGAAQDSVQESKINGEHGQSQAFGDAPAAKMQWQHNSRTKEEQR